MPSISAKQFKDALEKATKELEKNKSLTPEHKEFRNVVYNTELPAADRAHWLLYKASEMGLDLSLPMAELVNRLDEMGALCKEFEGMDQGHLISEWFLGESKLGIEGTLHALVTTNDKPIHVPIGKDLLARLKPGCGVLVNTKAGSIVGIEDRPMNLGMMCKVKEVIRDADEAPTHEVIVTHKDDDVVAYLIGDLVGKAEAGDTVVMDDERRVISRVIKAKPTGDDIITPVEILDGIDVREFGDINPIVDEILFNAKAFVQHRDFCDALRIPRQTSYLFSGPTGTGKSTALKIVARELMDHVKDLTGKKVSRLCTADATDFWSPYFGESERKIKEWFDKMRAAASKKVYDRNGNEVTIPLLVVIEEGEALFRSRSHDSASAHLFDRPLSLMLQLASSVGSEINAPVIMVMTSNRASLIDAAAMRRFGMNQAFFDCLNDAQAKAVLQKKIDRKIPLEDGTPGENVNRILGYLYGDEPAQPLAIASFGSGGKKELCRRDLVTPAIIDTAVDKARKVALRKSVDKDKLIGIESDVVINCMHEHFIRMAGNFKPHNLDEYLPSWFANRNEQCTGLRLVASKF